MDSHSFKLMLAALLVPGAFAAPACSVSFPPSYIDLQDEAYSPELDLHFHLCALAHHYFPDCVPAEKPVASAPVAAAVPPDPDCPEERLFAAGREELRRNPENRFPGAWQELLALPESERPRRTAQTLYLLGNLQAQENPTRAYFWYQKLREAVGRGVPDPRNLAEQSFRTNYFYAKDPVQRMRFLVLAAAFGRCSGDAQEVNWQRGEPCPFRRELWNELGAMIRRDPNRFLRDPLTAEVAVLFRPELVRQVSGPFVCGDRLALRAFRNGAFDDCRKLLAGSAPDSPLRLYLEARLARREGRFEQSAALLRKWLEHYRRTTADSAAAPQLDSIRFSPAGHGWNPFPEWSGLYWPASCRTERLPGRGMEEEVRGQVGATQYHSRLFLEALYSFLMGNAWSDAALVAEEQLDVAELRRFADAHETNPQLPPEMKRKLRHLLARRLMRENRFAEAERYFPAGLREVCRAFATEAATAENPALSGEERAAAWFRMGQIMLRHDIALFGYELAPDYFICDGAYDGYPIRQRAPRALPRFHYRLREAGCFRMAEELSQEPAFRFLATLSGGLVLRNRTPAAAEEFYHRLVRLRFAPYSPELDRFRWIPAPPAGWKERIAAYDVADRDGIPALIAQLLSGLDTAGSKTADQRRGI